MIAQPSTRVALEGLGRAVASILAAADADIATRRPVCRSSGRCCHFEEWGHRLYVTEAEMVHFAQVHLQAPAAPVPAKSTIDNPESKMPPLLQFFAAAAPRGCPFQIEGLCTAREARPLGCRIYFCDETSQSWQNEVYEKYHGQLREVHERFGVPYRYLEWREALRARAEG